MFKRNWSIWLMLVLVFGGILYQYSQDRFARDQRVSIEEVRLEDVHLGVDSEQATSFVWDETIALSSDENLADVSNFDGTAYYLTAVNQLREQYAYTYRLYRYTTEAEMVIELPDAKPHRLSLVGLDSVALIFTKEYSDGKTALVSYHLSSGQFSTISQWDGPPSRAQISYFQNTIGVLIDTTWGFYNLLGQPRTVEKRLPPGATVQSLGSSQSIALIYYEVDELRYMMMYRFMTKQASTWLVNDRVSRIHMQSSWAVTQSDQPTLQMYALPDLSVQRLHLEGNLQSVRAISDQLVDIRLVESRHRPFIYNLSTRQLVFNQVADPVGGVDETIYYYYVPAVNRLNRLHFVK